jgi:methylmalonyl-CoA/ethylmalonyl-CoA epimerase
LIEQLDHIAIAVRSLEEVVPFYRDSLGLPFLGYEEIPDQQVKVAMFQLGTSRIELLEPLSESSPISKFVQERGNGLHHIALRTHSLAGDLDRLAEGGLRLIDRHPRAGAGGQEIAFIHPKSSHGVLLELTQPNKGREDEGGRLNVE